MEVCPILSATMDALNHLDRGTVPFLRWQGPPRPSSREQDSLRAAHTYAALFICSLPFISN